jgi:Fic family protein
VGFDVQVLAVLNNGDFVDDSLQRLPFYKDVESKKVLKKLTAAHRALAELKGVVKSIPSEAILLRTLSLQEAKDSSAIENIITTHDELYCEDIYPERMQKLAAKEVRRYSSALLLGFNLIKSEGMLRNKTICAIQAELEQNSAGFRKVPGTVLKNNVGQIVYTPPQDPHEIITLMDNLEQYINNKDLDDLDPLVKMALIHYQFESIHPFYDGNGRTGRIINVLYLVLSGLLDLPILYASRYIVQSKAKYYYLLQALRAEGCYEEWILYILSGIEQTAIQTMKMVEAIVALMQKYSEMLKERYTFYNKDLLDSLFTHPYTKVEFIQNSMGVSRVTAMRYLKAMVEDGILEVHKLGKAHYFVNIELYKLLMELPPFTEFKDK